jgi:hypothetical protein
MRNLTTPIIAVGISGLFGCVDVPRYNDVTALEDGAFVVSRDSLEAFESGRAVERIATEHCAAMVRQFQQVDRSSNYINSAGEAKFRVTLTFRCVDAAAVKGGGNHPDATADDVDLPAQ